ncbi:ASCH domain-containing protein [Flavobacterium lipolyticum]|uniref:ASCH domain-containing protein n=1 Tax=Flavobacterium lipolyticum TaxID=2893754 RepID=A0ABS8LWJ6_9FLAO|nr:ASCH domain-containing protein [Flavobacterium sp. F-126]MCC9016945.1 ASCH domain-containing protein [Flavobacterium sp. F-126]
MKTLSIKQPWAHLICTPRVDNPLLGIKDIENRTWQTHFRGRIYVHASGSPAKEPYKIFTDEQASIFIDSYLDFKMLESYKQTSQIIGEVEIIDCVINHPSIWAEKTEVIGTTVEGVPLYKGKPIWNWVLANPVLYDKPILNVKGKLSLWEYNKELVF